jgi:DNA/RNA-binding domain of Phe-tRNA-synthetase-like protein
MGAELPSVTIAPELHRKVRLGLAVLSDLEVRAADPALDAERDEAARALRERHRGEGSGSVPGVEAARALYKSLGLDPTKTRPSNEALLRRVLKGESLYKVNTLVDALNLCSLRQQLPYGLYDRDAISGAVTLRLGAEGESYEGIRKGPVHVSGRPVLGDERGAFGNPTSDSARTQITLETRNALVVLYAPFATPAGAADAALRETVAALARFGGGTPGAALVL